MEKYEVGQGRIYEHVALIHDSSWYSGKETRSLSDILLTWMLKSLLQCLVVYKAGVPKLLWHDRSQMAYINENLTVIILHEIREPITGICSLGQLRGHPFTEPGRNILVMRHTGEETHRLTMVVALCFASLLSVILSKWYGFSITPRNVMRMHKAKSPSIEPAMDKALNEQQVPFPAHTFLRQKSYKLSPPKAYHPNEPTQQRNLMRMESMIALFYVSNCY